MGFRLLAVMAIALIGLTSCGDDDGDQDNDNGPAADVQGVWKGTYASDRTDRQGNYCLQFEQDQRELTGTLVFEGEGPLQIGGRIANERMSFVWGPVPGATSSSSEISFTSGGTFSGDVAGEQVTGTWSSIDSDAGTWSGTRDPATTCG